MRRSCLFALSILCGCGPSTSSAPVAEPRVEDPSEYNLEDQSIPEPSYEPRTDVPPFFQELRQLFHDRASTVAPCYEPGSPSYRVGVRVTVFSDGKSRVNASGAGSETLQHCVRDAIAAWPFPARPSKRGYVVRRVIVLGAP